MTRFGYQAFPVETNLERRRQELIQSEDRPGIFRLVGDAVDSEWSTSWAWRALSRRGYEVDPTWLPDDEDVARLTEGLPEEMWEAFDIATSRDHADRIREQMLGVLDSRQTLSQAGWKGSALRFGAALFDPGFIAAGLAATAVAGPLGGGAVAASKAGRLTRLVRGGLIAGIPEVGVQAYISGQDPEQDLDTVVYAGLGAFALGGAINALSRGKVEHAARAIRKDMEFQDVIQAAMGAAARNELNRGTIAPDVRALLDRTVQLTDEGKAYFKDQLEPHQQALFRDDIIKASGLDEIDDADLISELRSLEPADALHRFMQAQESGAAFGKTPGLVAEDIVDAIEPAFPDDPVLPPKKAGDLDLSKVDDTPASWTRFRRSYASILGSEKAPPAVRKAASAYAEDALPKQGGKPTGISASEWTRRNVSRFMGRFNRVEDAAWKAYAKKKGINPVFAWAKRDEFLRMVGPAIRRGDLRKLQGIVDKEVLDVASEMQNLFLEIGEIAQRHGVKGMEEFIPDDSYFPRIWAPGQINKLIAHWGTDEPIVDLLTESLIKGTSDLDDPDIARKVAKGALQTIRDSDKYTDVQRGRIFSGDLAEELETILKAEIDDPDLVEDILFGVRAQTADPKDANKIPRSRHRMRLDETTEITLPNGETLRLEHLLENNAADVYESYTRSMIGASAAKEVYRTLTPPGRLKSLESFDQVRKVIQDDAIAEGQLADATKEQLRLLEDLDKTVRGVPLTDGRMAKISRHIRALNYIRMSGGFGLAQIPEVVAGATEGGVRVFLQQAPVYREVFSRAKNGELSNEYLDFIETAFGLGTDRLNNRIVARMDHTAEVYELAGGRGEQILRAGGKAVSDVSFMAPINMFAHRASALWAIQRFVNIAKSGRVPSGRRLAALGMTKEDGRYFFDAIRRQIDNDTGGIVTEKGVLGRRVTMIHPDKWDDQVAMSQMIDAVQKWSMRVIQQNDIGNLHPLMARDDLIKMITQFRSFMWVSWEKQFLHRLSMRDWTAATTAITGSIAGAMVYTGQHYVRSLSKPDPQEYRDEWLSEDKIISAGVQRSGASSLLPMFMDSAIAIHGFDPLFRGRNTMMATGLTLDSNPTIQSTNDIASSYQAIAKWIRGEEDLSRSDLHRAGRAVGFQQIMGMSNLIDAMANKFDLRDR